MMGRFNIRQFMTVSLIAAACAGLAFAMYLWWFGPFDYVGPYDLVIRNGRVLDGLGNPPFRADIAIRDGRIAALGRIRRTPSEQTIDAAGQIVAPGFIDVHTHIEKNLPEGSKPFGAPNFILQGVSTIITGNCGTSVTSLKDMFKRLKKNGSQVNVASFIGHNTMRRKVMKRENRAPTREEIEELKSLVSKAMKQGALGLSTGLAYVPGAYAKKNELVELSRVVSQGGGIYVSHIRDEGLEGAEAIKEACEIGEEAHLPVHISHFKAAGRSQWRTVKQRLGLVDQASQTGLRITMDQYPYTASSTGLDLLAPSWALAGESSEVKRRLRDPYLRARISSEMLSQLYAKGWDDYSFARIAYCPSNTALNGLSITEATAMQARISFEQRDRKSSESLSPLLPSRRSAPNYSSSISMRVGGQDINAFHSDYDARRQAEFILDLIAKGGAHMVYFEMDEEDVLDVMKHADTMFGSDSAVRSETTEAVPHPRGIGTFPRVLSRYVREFKVLSMEEAVRRMTSLPARIFGLKDRGQITEGYYADMVIFKPDYVSDMATFEVPLRPPQGIYYVIVNGTVVLENDRFTGSSPGRPIRHR